MIAEMEQAIEYLVLLIIALNNNEAVVWFGKGQKARISCYQAFRSIENQ